MLSPHFWNDFYTLALLGVATGTLVSTTARAKIFVGARDWIAAKNPWLGDLVRCTYCSSHWAAIGLVLVYRPTPVEVFLPVDLLVSVFLTVFVSAFTVGVIGRLVTFPPVVVYADDDDEEEEEDDEEEDDEKESGGLNNSNVASLNR